MNPKYTDTIQQITAWAAGECGIHGLVLIGSQARSEQPADAWSDLDLMVLVDDPLALMKDAAWPERFGRVVCWFEEVVPLHSYSWSWHVKRVLYDDMRDVDFSVLPYGCLNEVLAVNSDILGKGWRVLSADEPDWLSKKIQAAVAAIAPAGLPPGEEELSLTVSNLLYHVVWAMKKVRRGELWVAVSCINSYMKDLLLPLVEAHNAAVTRRPDTLAYSGRFLEQRTDPVVLERLKGCFTGYDEAQAAASLGCLIEVVDTIWRDLCAHNGWRFDPAPFEQVRAMLADMASL